MPNSYTDVAIRAAHFLRDNPQLLEEPIRWWNEEFSWQAARNQEAQRIRRYRRLKWPNHQIRHPVGYDGLNIYYRLASAAIEGIENGHFDGGISINRRDSARALFLAAFDRDGEFDWQSLGIAVEPERHDSELVDSDYFLFQSIVIRAWSLLAGDEHELGEEVSTSRLVEGVPGSQVADDRADRGSSKHPIGPVTLHPSDLTILRWLATARTTMSQYALEQLGPERLSRGTISARLKALRKAGLVSRPHGARSGEAITHAGRDLLRRLDGANNVDP